MRIHGLLQGQFYLYLIGNKISELMGYMEKLIYDLV
jgi:hypothetical protein